MSTKKELGTFCEQFNYVNLLYPFKKHKKEKRNYKNYSSKKQKYWRLYKKNKHVYNKQMKNPKMNNRKKKKLFTINVEKSVITNQTIK